VVTTFFITFKFLLKYIRKKEKPKDGKHDKKLDQDNAPELFAPGHGPKTIAIKPENPF
jgi:hypothetical protein